MSEKDLRAEHEINHGEYLSQGNPEEIWGWSTPAGKQRAERRAQLIGYGAKLAPGKKALEVGCGTGNFTKKFARFGCSIVACDISKALLDEATSRNLPQDQVEFTCSRFENCGIQERFDAIIGSSVLHHLELEAALPKMFDMLKPNGSFCFAEPNMLNPQLFIQLKFRRYFPHFSPDETAFVRFKLKPMLENVGFVDVSITPFDWLHPSVPHSLITTVKNVGKMFERIPLICEFSGSLLIKARKYG
jgi:2-polyprenyl-3-methyl-5-hydroxy-6-metoxy-1,4-benzoquinol methylase